MTEEKRRGDWMQTYSGNVFWPLDPRADEVYIEDIAHALSHMCRYNGHVEKFYSVAQHSVLVSRNLPGQHKLWGLLHDAPEAYSPDVIRPIKKHLEGFKVLEDRLMGVICERFDLHSTMPAEVKRVDNAILGDEEKAVMKEPPMDWYLPEPPLGIEITPWSPEIAKKIFLDTFYELTAI